MPVSIEQLEGYLMQDELLYHIEDDRITLSFAMNDYVGPGDAGKALLVGIRIVDDGEQADIVVPFAYDARRAVDLGKLCELLLWLNFRHKMFRWELNRQDRWVHGSIPFLPRDGTVTRQAFVKWIRWVAGMIDFWHPVIDRAIREGVLPEAGWADQDFRLVRMVAQAGGVDRLVAIAEQELGPPAPPDGHASPAPPTWGGWLRKLLRR